MSKKISKTPQQKKRESYAKDRRNTYGENAKASRKGIPRKKRQQSRSERRVVNQAIAQNTEFDADNVDAAEAKFIKKRKGVWRLKLSDEPLGAVVARKIERRVKTGEVEPSVAESKLRRVQRLTKSGSRESPPNTR